MKKLFLVLIALNLFNGRFVFSEELSYPVVDTAQRRFYNEKHEIRQPALGESFYGQDSMYEGHSPRYKDNQDGTVTDMVTGLMWTKDPGEKQTLSERIRALEYLRVGGYSDWRIPTIKELYSLIDFSGIDPDPKSTGTLNLQPFIDTDFFAFSYGNVNQGERLIDSQFISATKYVHKTMHGDDTFFGVNFADGRIKGYPVINRRTQSEKKFFCIYVRGNRAYGKNDFVNNYDGTVTDKATGLMWMQEDSGHLKAGIYKNGKLNWEEALMWAENLDYAGYSDWRLPNAKELQSIVDYTKSPSTTDSPAINDIFKTTSFVENGTKEYPYFWTSTTHKQLMGGASAVYISFGRGLGWVESKRTGEKMLLDVHGAGCQRSDPKSGYKDKYPYGRGPQGDVINIYNFVRAVRSGKANVMEGSDISVENNVTKFSAPASNVSEKRGVKGKRPSFVSRLDKDGDSKVSLSEFDGPKHHFRDLDKDGDGYLLESEAPKGPPPKRR